jgi:hypothetical protein
MQGLHWAIRKGSREESLLLFIRHCLRYVDLLTGCCLGGDTTHLRCSHNILLWCM